MTLVRAAAGAAAVVAAAACAHVEAPPGGPIDQTAPGLVTTRPDTSAVVPAWTGPAVFVFDEGLSEEGVREAVSLSPRRGPVAVDKEGDEIRVRPRRGWQPGTIYQVEVAPGVRDRFNNRRTEAIRLVFSTGPEIPDTRAEGTVTQRVTGQAAEQARVDAVRLADSLTYTTAVDSAGGFRFAQIPPGEYLLLAYRDVNRSGDPDPFEARDSATVAIAEDAAPEPVALAVVLPDSTPPRVTGARMAAQWVEVRFDDYLDPSQPLSAAQVTIAGPDGAVAVDSIRVGAPADTARADTAQRDTGAAARPARPDAPADTGRASTPRQPLPSQSLYVRPAAPLLPDTAYTVTVRDVRNVNGLVGGGEAPLRTPRPAPPPEARPDPGGAAPPPPPDSVPAAPPAPVEPEPEQDPEPQPPTDPPGTPFAAAAARTSVFPNLTGS